MSSNITISQCETILNEGVITIANMGRILNEIKSSKSNELEYKQIETLFVKRWGIQSSELETIIEIFKKTKK